MRITVNQYAKSLYELARVKSQDEIDLVVANLFRILQKNRQMKLAKKIMEKFSDIYNRENGIVEARITSKEMLSEDLLQKVSNYVSDRYGAKEVLAENIVDEKIKGGIIIKVGDELLDASVAGMLVNLKKELIK